MKEKDDSLVIVLLLGIVLLIGVLIIFIIQIKDKITNNTNAYQDNIIRAIDNFNDSSLDWVINQKLNRGTPISPLSVQYTLFDYMESNNINDDRLFLMFNNGIDDFRTSGAYLRDSSIDSIIAGEVTRKQVDVEIHGNPIYDEKALHDINYRIRKSVGGELRTIINYSNVDQFAMYSLSSLNEQVGASCFRLKDKSSFVVKGNLRCKFTDRVWYAEIPLKDSQYTLLCIKGDLSKYSEEWRDTGIEKKVLNIKLPKIHKEVMGYPVEGLKKTSFYTYIAEDFVIDKTRSITRLVLFNSQYEGTFTGTEDIDYSSDSILIFRNNLTGLAVMYYVN